MATGSAVHADQERLGPQPQRCVRHPHRETLVSCGRCGRPFCPECLIHTPAGQRCYECAGVRRRAAGTAATGALLKAFGVVVLGSAIGSLFGLLGLLAGGVTGQIAGQIVGPSVNRHTRRVLYPLALALAVAGALLGWSAAHLMRALPLLLAAAHGAGPAAISYVAGFLVVSALDAAGNLFFWLFLAILVAVGYQRVR